MRYLLVDRIEEAGAEHIRGWKNVAMSEDYLEWHFPEKPIMPGVLVLEALSQLAGWMEASSSSFERWVLLDRVRSARYYRFAVPGDRVALSVDRVESEDENRRTYRAQATVNGERAAVVEFEAQVVALEDLESRDTMRRSFDALLGAPEGP